MTLDKETSVVNLRFRSLAALFSVCFLTYESAASSVTPTYDFGESKIIIHGQPLTLKCTIDDPGFTFTWKKDGKEIEGDEIERKPFFTELVIKKAKDVNAGLYECVATHNTTQAELNATIHVISKPLVSMDADHIVVEGEKLTLECQVTGVPPPSVSWIIESSNTTLTNSTERIKLLAKDEVVNAILQIDEVKISDHGEYKCMVSNNATRGENLMASTRVRVKDKLAALWPFLGICAEVFVLCAIIFIYEKKRNKAELDESDTDNSPEQKNTPDHGKDSVRQRK